MSSIILISSCIVRHVFLWDSRHNNVQQSPSAKNRRSLIKCSVHASVLIYHVYRLMLLHVFKLVSLVKFNFIIVIAINFVKNAYLSLLVILPSTQRVLVHRSTTVKQSTVHINYNFHVAVN